jgi:tetrahydromethanopterin S-methyltransferase subunit D
MIIENQPLVNRYISTPKDLSGLNTAAFVAGIIQGILDGADLVC